MARAMISQARGIAIAQHRQAGVVFFEETVLNSRPVNAGTAMQLFVEDYDQAQYAPSTGITVFVPFSNERQYLPGGIALAALNDQPDRGVMTADATTGGNTRAILFDAGGQMILRHGLARQNLPSGTTIPGTYPRAARDWSFTTAHADPSLGISCPGIFLFDAAEYKGAGIPTDASGNAQRNLWIKQHADAVILNTYTGGFIQ